MNLRCIVLSKSSLTLKPTYSMILFIWHSDQVSTFSRGRKQISGYWVIRARGEFDLQRNIGKFLMVMKPLCILTGVVVMSVQLAEFYAKGVHFTVSVIPTFFWESGKSSQKTSASPVIWKMNWKLPSRYISCDMASFFYSPKLPLHRICRLGMSQPA